MRSPEEENITRRNQSRWHEKSPMCIFISRLAGSIPSAVKQFHRHPSAAGLISTTAIFIWGGVLSGLDGHQGVWFNTLVSASFEPCFFNDMAMTTKLVKMNK